MSPNFDGLFSHSVPEDQIADIAKDNMDSVNERGRELEEAGATGMEYIVGLFDAPTTTQDSSDCGRPGYDPANDGRDIGAF